MGYPPTSSAVPYAVSGSSLAQRKTERSSARRDSSANRTPNKDVVEYDGSVKATLLEEYRYVITVAIETNLSVMIQRNQKVWEVTLRHFEMEIKEHIDQGTMRVLRKLSEGPYTRVIDPTLRKIWEAEVCDQLTYVDAIADDHSGGRNGLSLSKARNSYNPCKTI